MVNSPALGVEDDIVKKWAKEISNDKELEGYQLMVLSESYDAFRDKYPYLCLANKELYGDKLAEDEKSKSVNLT